MTKKIGDTGKKFEDYVSSRLSENGYALFPKKDRNKNMPRLPHGGKHFPDIRLRDGRLVSCKSQDKTEGTADEKIPFECLKLQYAIECSNGSLTEAIIIVHGRKWKRGLKEWYLSKEFHERMNIPNVRIISDDMIDDVFPPLNPKNKSHESQTHHHTGRLFD